MPVIYNQAIAHRFGSALIEALESGDWTSFTAAVAWVRRSGTRHLLPSFRKFLEGGAIARLTVGVDIENSSREGLEDLLSLGEVGDCKTLVFHNESPTVTFHPKVYLFSNARRARLIVGSNNRTEAGSFTNTEVALQIDAKLRDQVIVDAMMALNSWSDTSEALVRELSVELMMNLIDGGYIVSEAALRARRRESSATRLRAPRSPLFGSRTVSAPLARVAGIVAGPAGAAASRGAAGRRVASGTPSVPAIDLLRVRGHPHPLRITNVLLMRVRAARGGKQIQIPVQLKDSSFLNTVTSLVSARDGAHRPISATYPERGGKGPNTYKVEMPELVDMAEPVVRIEKSAAGVISMHTIQVLRKAVPYVTRWKLAGE